MSQSIGCAIAWELVFAADVGGGSRACEKARLAFLDWGKPCRASSSSSR
jgi:hypothetical protein